MKSFDFFSVFYFKSFQYSNIQISFKTRACGNVSSRVAWLRAGGAI